MSLALLLVVPVLVLVVVWPRHAVLLLWPAILLYPRNLLFGLLPLNANLDQIFTVCLSLRLMADGKTAPWPRRALALVVMMVLMQLVAEATGLFRYEQLASAFVKNTLKGLVFVAFALAMALAIRGERDVRRLLMSLCLGASVACLLVFVSPMWPAATQFWEVRPEGIRYLVGELSWRGHGPFNGPAEVGIVVCMSVPIALGLIVHTNRDSSPGLFRAGMLLLVCSLLALVSAKTRSGVLGLGGAFAAMFVFSAHRKALLGVLARLALPAAALFVAREALVGAAQSRLAEAVIGESLVDRLAIWEMVVATPGPMIWFFGEGLGAGVERVGASPHNGYLDVVLLWGVGGAVCFAVLYRNLVRWGGSAMRAGGESATTGFAWGVRWGTLAVALAALVSDPWYCAMYRYVVFFSLVVLEKRLLAGPREDASPMTTRESAAEVSRGVLPQTCS